MQCFHENITGNPVEYAIGTSNSNSNKNNISSLYWQILNEFMRDH